MPRIEYTVRSQTGYKAKHGKHIHDPDSIVAFARHDEFVLIVHVAKLGRTASCDAHLRDGPHKMCKTINAYWRAIRQGKKQLAKYNTRQALQGQASNVLQ